MDSVVCDAVVCERGRNRARAREYTSLRPKARDEGSYHVVNERSDRGSVSEQKTPNARK